MRAVLFASATATTRLGRRPAQSDHPGIGIGCLRAQQIGAGAVDQEPSQIAVAALGYPAQANLAPGRILPWHQTKPGRKLAPAAEAAWLRNRRGDRRSDDRPDARDRRQLLADRVALVPRHE